MDIEQRIQDIQDRTNLTRKQVENIIGGDSTTPHILHHRLDLLEQEISRLPGSYNKHQLYFLLMTVEDGSSIHQGIRQRVFDTYPS